MKTKRDSFDRRGHHRGGAIARKQMEEVAQGMSQSQDTGVSNSGAAPVAETTQPSERTFRQSEVNDIVKKAKYGAVEDYKRLSTQQPDYVARRQENHANDYQTPSDERFRQLAAEEAKRLRDEWVRDAETKSQTEAAEKTVRNFWDKVRPGKDKYQDFDKVTGDIELGRFPNVVQMLGDHVDNSHDILYELGKDRMKLVQLEMLAQHSPRDALIQAQRLSQSLRDNETAANTRVPNEPLHQMRPSHTGTQVGNSSVTSLRAKYRV